MISYVYIKNRISNYIGYIKNYSNVCDCYGIGFFFWNYKNNVFYSYFFVILCFENGKKCWDFFK